MNQIARHLLTTLLGIVIAVTFAPGSAAALDLAPPTTEPKPNLWAEFEVDCFGNGTSPGVHWSAGNGTNGSVIFSLIRNGNLVFDFKVESGNVESSALHAPHWEDSYQHFEIRWKSQDVVLAQTKPWLNCVEPILSASFGPVDDQGRPCAGVVPVTIANSGNQNAAVRLYQQAPAVFKTLVVHPGSSETADVPMLAGQTLSGSYLNFGSHEFFFGVEVVECPPAPPEPPEPPLPPEPPQGGDGQDGPPANEGGGGGDGGGSGMNEDPGEPGGTLETDDGPEPGVGEELPEPVMKDRSPAADSEVAGLALDREIGRLLGRQASDGAAPGGLPLWPLWLVLVLALAVATRAALRRA